MTKNKKLLTRLNISNLIIGWGDNQTPDDEIREYVLKYCQNNEGGIGYFLDLFGWDGGNIHQVIDECIEASKAYDIRSYTYTKLGGVK